MSKGEQMANTLQAFRYQDFCKSASDIKTKREEGRFPNLQVPEFKEVLPGGIPRGGIAEVYGSRSSGRTSVCLVILAQATAQGEICAVVDLNDSFDPASAAAAGVRLDALTWIRCGGNVEHAIRATDLILHAGGFGVVSLDLCEANARALNRIPISYWHRFRRAVEHTPTVLLITADIPQAKSCSSQSLHTKRKQFCWSGNTTTPLLRGLEMQAASAKLSAIQPHPLFFKSVV